MAHPRARLSVFSRQLLVKRVVVDGWPVATVSEQLGHQPGDRLQVGPPLSGRRTARSRGPQLPTAPLAAPLVRRGDRRDHPGPRPPALRSGPPGSAHRPSALDDLRRPPRAGLNRLRDTDRVTGAPVRYVACHPGALVHQDHKKLGRVPDGGGWRVLGRDQAPSRSQGPRLRPSRGLRRRRQSLCRRRAGRRRARRERLVGGRARDRPVRRGRGPHRADPHRQRRELPQPRLSRRPRPPSTSATSAPGPTGRRPTARPSASSRRCSTSGPTPGPIARTHAAYRRCPGSSTSTITDVRTPRSEASCPASLSTTSPNTTPRSRSRRRRPGGHRPRRARPPSRRRTRRGACACGAC